MILDEEVFAVILAITVVASVLSAALVVRDFTGYGEPFISLGLLDSECRIGRYPSRLLIGVNQTLCVFIYNSMRRPVLCEVRLKIAINRSTLPTDTTPSPADAVARWRRALPHATNVTFKVGIMITEEYSRLAGSRVILVFELWLYDTKSMKWSYSGRWTSRHITLEG